MFVINLFEDISIDTILYEYASFLYDIAMLLLIFQKKKVKLENITPRKEFLYSRSLESNSAQEKNCSQRR